MNFVILSAMLGGVFLVSQVFAWTEPSSVPPSNNVQPPVNVSTTAQVKSGALGLLGANPGAAYGLSVNSGGAGAIGTKNNSSGVELNLNTAIRGLYLDANKDSYIGVYSKVRGADSYGGLFMNTDLNGTGLYSWSSNKGAMITGKETGMLLSSDNEALNMESGKTVVNSKLRKSNKTVSATKLNFFKNPALQSVPVALGAYNYAAPNYNTTNSYVEMGMDNVGLKVQGNLFAAQFDGNVEVKGVLNVTGGCNGCGDLAESMLLAERVSAGDIVATDGRLRLMKATARSKTVIGVISTKPSMNLNSQEIDGAPVALSGIVPVKVTSENGQVVAGDFIAASSIPGYGMRATAPGTVVGKALESLSGERGTIKMFVDLGWFGGEQCSCKK